jgi:hypothetical protein
MSDSKTWSRREVLRRTLVVLAAAPVMGTALSGCGGDVSCAGTMTPPMLATRSAVHYIEHGPVAARHCSGCQLYTGTPTACGTCASVPGSINPHATCDAFVTRS